jgi:hypothetical protein
MTRPRMFNSSTLSEAKPWGEIDHEAGVSLAHVEASMGLPLVAGYVIGKAGRRKPRRLERLLRGDTARSIVRKYAQK